MRHEDREITSINDLVNSLRAQTVAREILWFRGHADRDWKLVPGLGRNQAHLAKETEVIKRFVQLSVPHLTEPPPKTDWEWIFLMQHYGVPTRLLDWTESPLTAMWFAMNGDASTENKDGAVWCLAPLELNRHARFRGKLENELPGFDADEILDGYLPDRQAGGQGKNAVAATGPRNSRRIAAQLGNFTIFDRASEPIEEIGDKNHVWRWIVPAHARPNLLEELRLLRLTELSFFPDLDRVSKLTRELLA
ncbi:Conserved hypothetical protein [gamma proteobacterium HdN1]|nr:Conserved hypothetical protein [gamma proteobacterium HdN1]